MRNSFLSKRTGADVDKTVDKILRDLGNPAPPLRLDLVRELLNLDRSYYTPNEPGLITELVHRLKLAGKQIVKRPMLLFDAIKNFDLKALFLPDKRRILLDSTVPTAKQRWSEAHEISHSILPWHEAVMLGDTTQTLNPACHNQVESEANYSAGRLLFIGDRFKEELDGPVKSIDQVKKLAKAYGNTITSTLWRSVEASDVPVVGLVGGHPRHMTKELELTEPFRYMIRSRSFEAQFGSITEHQLLTALNGYCSYQKRGPLGSAEIMLKDDNGKDHVFIFESFSNSYDVLTLCTYKAPRKSLVAVVSASMEW